MRTRTATRRAFGAMLAIATLPAGLNYVFAQSSAAAGGSRYPTRTIRMIVPYAPGGTHDTIARLFGQKLSEALNQPVVIDNRPGAGGTIAALAAAKAPADGYTLFVADVGANAIAPTLYAAPGYDTARDFSAVALSGTHPTVIAVHPSLPAGNLPELIALAKAKPGTLAYGSVGAGSLSQLVMELLKSVTGVDMLHVPYKGGPALLNAAMGGEVQVAAVSVQSAMPFISTGRLKAIAQMGAKRSSLLPDIPTLVELGYRGVVAETWAGFLVPFGTPNELVQFLNQELNRIGRIQEVRGRLQAMGWEPMNATPEEFRRFMAAEGEKYAKLIRSMNVKPE